MKFLLSFILVVPCILIAQNDNLKHDYIWLTGYSSNSDQLEFGGTVIDFNVDTVETYYEFRQQNFDVVNTTLCNGEGELIFSTDNLSVFNALNEVMENGHNLNPDPTIQDRTGQAVLALPSPANDSTYFLLHNEVKFVPELYYGAPVINLKLYKTVIDLKYDSNPSVTNLGKVIDKNVPIIQDTLVYGRLTATRHANGRDWWIIQQQYGTNKFYRFLLDNTGLIEKEAMYVGADQLYNTSGVGQAVFSPDGSKYILVNSWDTQFPAHVDFFDFDRCTGNLYNFERLTLSDNTERPRGIAISPNSRFCYLSTNDKLYQIDLNLNDIQLSLIQSHPDTVTSPFYLQLAPNGKIYMSGSGSATYMHVVNNPDLQGIDCNPEYKGLLLPTYNYRTIPNHPNYRLGRLVGSPCDTIYADTTSTISMTEESPILKVFPNPASNEITVNISSDFAINKITIANTLGVKVTEVENQKTIDISHLPVGIYWITVQNGTGSHATEKVLIAR